MEREQVTEFHYITPIANVPSILANGLLSHHRAAQLPHHDISMQEIQDARSGKTVPGGLPLHDYVNLYFNGRNKMMAKKRPIYGSICVLRVRPEVLDFPNAIIADQNASSKYVCFLPSPAGLKKLLFDHVFIRDWRCPNDQILEWKLGSRVNAELLIPHQLSAEWIFGAFVLHLSAQSALALAAPGLTSDIHPDIFL